MANLRQCFMSESTEWTDKDRRASQAMGFLDRTQGSGANTVLWGQGSSSRTLCATSLQMVLKGLIEYILRCSKSCLHLTIEHIPTVIYHFYSK